MNDRLKFRCVINNKVKDVFYFYELPTNKKIVFACTNLEDNKGHYIPKCQLFQCTGLKDKNGKLIYEGDILGGSYKNLYVHWCDKCKQFQLMAQDYGCMACEGDIHWCEVVEDNNELEVIGNIYENPELLKECE